MKRIFMAMLLYAALCLHANAQKTKAKVVDASTGAALTGATISLQTNQTITTDNSGSFEFDCTKNQRLTISFIGYITQTVNAKDCESFTVSLLHADNMLNNVEITATSSQNKALLYQPVSISKLTSVELKRGTGLFLDDAINGNVPGVTMNRRAVSSGQQFNIRGYGNGTRGTRGISSNFDGQGYKVYLNGIPVTDAEGITVMDDIDFSSIGNVEVVKGPAGTLYGLAIAGVINLKTIRPEKGTSIGQDVLIGNYGLQRFTTHFQTANDRSSILVNYGNQQSEGFTVHNASHKNFVNLAGEFMPNPKQTVNTYFSYSNSYDERSGELTITQYNNNDYSGNIEYIKRNAHSEVFTVRAGVGHTYAFNEKVSNNTVVFGTAFNSNASSAGGWTDKASTNIGFRSSFDTRFTSGVALISGITGFETQRQNATTIGYGMIDPLGPAHVWKMGDPYFIIGSTTAGSNGITSDLYTISGTSSAFTEWTLSLPKDLSFTGGIGWSNMRIRLDDRFYAANKPTHYDTSYKNLFSPHFAINKVFKKQVSVYAAYSRGYKAPVSAYYFIPYVTNRPGETGIINRHLEPETGDQFEIGSKGSLFDNNLSYQLAVFHAVFSKKMTTVAVPFNASTTLYSYVINGGKQDDKGLEASVKYRVYHSDNGFFTSITPFANLTYSDYKYENFPFHIIVGTKDSIVNYNGKAVAGVAKLVYNLGVDIVTRPGLYGNVHYFHKDGMPITSDGINRTSEYGLLNARLGFRKKLSSHFDLDVFAGAGNIAGAKHPIMIFINQLPDAYIAGPRDANTYGGVSIKYIF